LAAAPASAEAARHLTAAEDLLKTTQQELSRLIAELRPAALEGQGLPDALRGYVSTWNEHSRIPAQVVVQHERALPLENEEALYRVAQEALANVARHSHASAVTVRLIYDAVGVTLTIGDNGVGFDPQQTPEGFGLDSMRQRLAALGGALEIVTSAEGTTVTAHLPADDGRPTTEDQTKDD
jgi:NarL family two-component system sensor histidine kinase LiaS